MPWPKGKKRKTGAERTAAWRSKKKAPEKPAFKGRKSAKDRELEAAMKEVMTHTPASTQGSSGPAKDKTKPGGRKVAPPGSLLKKE